MNKQTLSASPGPIGIFDSGFGGLTIYRDIKNVLPQYDYIYLGDNARAPYGSRSFDVVYEFTRQATLKLFQMGCHLVILACNTASAKALRSVQQIDLPYWDEHRRVLGIIRPTAEIAGMLTTSRHIGILGTEGTISSGSYPLEIKKIHPDILIASQACPMWVPLIESGEYANNGADYFVEKYIQQLFTCAPLIDAVILACTHYPLLINKIKQYIPDSVALISQGKYVANSLKNYMKRHPEIEKNCTQNGTTAFFTTESPEKFSGMSSAFLDATITAKHITIAN
ncbi:MAG: glutamate racemase [Bacteroidales bacterium]|jgi:glutamate racemase|nr:glutamate racemase [Bacteroidales bacterium]